MKSRIFLIVFLICNSIAFGQVSKNLRYKFPDQTGLPTADIRIISNRIIQAHKNIPEKKIMPYAQSVAFEEQSLYLNGNIYCGWVEMETYLNDILMKILPDSLKGRKDLHVFPARIAGINAYTYADGSIFFNVALFANVSNEASVAIILGHELGHYIMNDNINYFLKGKKKLSFIPVEFMTENKLQNRLEYAKYSRKQEIIADSIGFVLARHSGYNLFFGIDNFNNFEDIETDIEQKEAPVRIKENTGIGGYTKTEINKLLARHPENEQRIKKLYDVITSDSSGQKRNYIVSEPAFKKLQAEARFETLRILLENNPRECIKSSFINYLYVPDDPDYLYYLVESLRRFTSIDPKTKDLTFLTDDFLGKTFKKGEGILHDLTHLVFDSVRMTEIKATGLKNDNAVAFETYGQAYKYFTTIALEQNNREVYLSMALTEIDTSLRNQYLNKYLSFNNCWYKDYASALKNDTLYSYISKNTKDIFITDCPQNFYYSLSDYRKKYESHEGFIKAINKTPGKYFKDITICFSDDIPTVNLAELYGYFNLIEDFQHLRKNDTTTKFDVDKKTTYVNIDKGIDAFTLSPENWYFAIQKNIKSLRIYTAMNFEGCSGYVYSSCNLVKNTLLTHIAVQKVKKTSTKLYFKFLNDDLKFDKKGKTGFYNSTYY